MIKTSLGLPRTESLAILGNLRYSSEIFGNARKRSCDPQTNFVESLEIFGKWSQIFQKSSNTPSSLCLLVYNKKNITR